MNLLEQCFLDKKPKFIPYISLGDPEYALSVEWAKSLLNGGADILELGIPFSDPVADGPVIQKSYMRSLSKGFSMKKVFDTTLAIHNFKKNIPLLYLTSFNPILSYGIQEFFERAEEVGITGVVIPDLPFDSKDFIEAFIQAKKFNICIIQMVTPSSSKERVLKLKKYSSGFIYYVTSYGVTGERSTFGSDLKKKILETKKIFSLPVCAGFGISKPEQSKEISKYADGIIIGSAVQRIIEEKSNHVDACAKALVDYAREISNSII